MEPSRRLAYLDGLRALAVLSVIAYHAVCFGSWSFAELSAPMHPDPLWWIVTFMAKGSHGVDLFFVLSGLCLSYPALAKIAENGRAPFDVWSFFAKRLVRIGPPFWVALALTSLAVPLLGRFGVHARDVDPGGTAPLAVIRQALFLDRGVHLANGSFWTLFFEMRWYLAFPALLALYVRNRRAFFALLAGLVVAFDFTTLHAVDVAVLPAFMLGIVAADYRLRGDPFGRRLFLALYGSFALALALEPFSSLPPADGSAEVPLFAAQSNAGWQLTCFCFVVAAGRWPILTRALSWRPLTAIGVASYSVYLVHQPIVSYWEESFAASAGGWTQVAGAFGFALAGGAVFYAGVEAPLLAARFRGPAVAGVRRLVARTATVCGIPERLDLAREPALPATARARDLATPPVEPARVDSAASK